MGFVFIKDIELNHEQTPYPTMSFTLEDLINSLTQERGSQQRQPQTSSYYPQQFYYPYQEDDEEDDSNYYPNYPDYYPPFGFYGQDPRRSIHPGAQARAQAVAAKRAAQQEAARKLQQRQQAKSQTGEASTDDILDILSQLTGIPKTQFNVQNPAQGQGQGQAEAEASKPQNLEGEKSSKSEQVAKEEETTTEAEKSEKSKVEQSQVKGQSSIDSRPLSKRRHSAASFKEPQPKIEISQRNLNNPTVPFSPQSNVYDIEKEYVIVLAIPGASLKNLDIDFHPSTNEIIVKGSISDPFPEQGIKFNEIRTGNVERRFKFPALPKINDDNIKAKYLNGLLTIRVPKSEEEEVKPKKKVTIEEVPDEELIYEEHGGLVQ